MADSTDENLVDRLAEDFARRWRAGEGPTPEEYAARHPELADEIREVISGVLLMERLKPRPEDTEISRAPPVPARPMPRMLGEYRVVREIGRGGMGVVYEAVQESLGRRVAIKVLPAHLMADEKHLARFRREAQAAAKLHHTNIVPVFGVGESDRHCFYVMQLIDGRGLDAVVAKLCRHRDDTAPEGRKVADTAAADSPLPAPGSPAYYLAVARLGAQAADALAAAHAQGIVHRDIKPSNLLLDGRGTVWVTDFGVAKLSAAVNLTRSNEVVGTLRYMPPEQFAGQCDARGDVYSLGVTLYELLTLRPAFPDAPPQRLIQLITHVGFPPPRSVAPDIPTDLETIVLKATAREPGHRYQSAGELAEDLRRFLDDRPVLAKRTGPLGRAWRWCRRNPALATATTTAAALLVAVTAVSLAAAVATDAARRDVLRANGKVTAALAAETAQREAAEKARAAETAQREIAEKARAAEMTRREQAETASTLALGALNRLYDRFAATRLVAAPPAGDAGGELPIEPALTPQAVALMEELLRTYEQIARAGGEFPKLQEQAAEANQRIGDIRQRLGRFEEAAAAYRAALDLYAKLPADAARVKLARTCIELGRTLASMRQFAEADRLYDRAVRTLTDAPKELADRPECRFELARSYYTLGQRDKVVTLRGLGQGESKGGPPDKSKRGGPPDKGGKRPPPGPAPKGDGGTSTREAVKILTKLTAEFDAVPEYRHLLAVCYRDLANDRPGGNAAQAAEYVDKAVLLLRRLVEDSPKVPDYRLDLCETLGRPRHADRADERLKAERLREAIELSRPLVEEFPSVPDYTAAHVRYLTEFGVATFLAGDPAGATDVLRKAVAFQAKLAGQYPEVVGYGFWLSRAERALGRVLCERGEWSEARPLLESAVRRLEALRAKDPRLGAVRPQLAQTYPDLARARAEVGESALAAEARQKVRDFEADRGQAGDPFNPRR